MTLWKMDYVNMVTGKKEKEKRNEREVNMMEILLSIYEN
jgi:hypothetical protein